ncbi:MAG: Uma2 family endonuclease [Chloroflexi bacterium]|nr:Uma2 family endonuclease [Chloroflexota bacterium]
MEIKDAVPTVKLTDVGRIARKATRRTLPPLEGGDRLTRREFERRYEAMPHVKKAELIEGVVYMPSPVRFEDHSEPHGDIMAWLGAYRAATPGVRLGDNATLRLAEENEVQPDAMLRLDPEKGGGSRVSEDDYVEGSPELIVEIAASSAAYDLHDKLDAYRRNGVQEYIVRQVFDEKVDWLELQGGVYVPLAADEQGVIYSRVFPGLRLAVRALLEGDLATVLAELQKGLASDEHSAFVERLK